MTAEEKAISLVGRVIVNALKDSRIEFVHSSELCVLKFAAKCAEPEFEKAFNEILERVEENGKHT